jgi:hypothetical protein
MTASALELPLSELAAGAPAAIGLQRPGSAAASLRTLLAGAHSLCAMLGETHAPPLSVLRASTERACALTRAGSYEELAVVLAELLPGLEAAERTLPLAQQPDACELAAMAYQACATALVRLGQPLTSWIAADRAMAAAERAGNLLLAAAGQYYLASGFLDGHEFALADEAAQTTLTALRGLAELGDADALALCGGCTLVRAMAAARTQRPDAAYGHLAKARLLASRIGAQQPTVMPEFGAQFVALYEIAVSVDLGDAGHALRAAATMDMTGLSPRRQARMLIDVARAYALRSQVDEATAALVRAEDLGPCHPRDHERACRVIRDLAAMRSPMAPALEGLVSRMGTPAG